MKVTRNFNFKFTLVMLKQLHHLRMNKNSVLLYKKLFGRINHHQLHVKATLYRLSLRHYFGEFEQVYQSGHSRNSKISFIRKKNFFAQKNQDS